MIIQYIKHKVESKISLIKKINLLFKALSSIDIKVKGDSVLITLDKNIIINNTKDIFLYSSEGKLIIKHRRTHINPNVYINITEADTNDISKRSLEQRILLEKQSLFSRLLRTKQIHTR